VLLLGRRGRGLERGLAGDDDRALVERDVALLAVDVALAERRPVASLRLLRRPLARVVVARASRLVVGLIVPRLSEKNCMIICSLDDILPSSQNAWRAGQTWMSWKLERTPSATEIWFTTGIMISGETWRYTYCITAAWHAEGVS
jgi:hypothetical protein